LVFCVDGSSGKLSNLMWRAARTSMPQQKREQGQEMNGLTLFGLHCRPVKSRTESVG